jgi:small subunit ribosomal protein S20
MLATRIVHSLRQSAGKNACTTENRLLLAKLTGVDRSDILLLSNQTTKEHYMAQGGAVKHKKKTKSVLKNIRQAAQRQTVNQMNRTRVRTAIRRLRWALNSGDVSAAEKLTPTTYSALDKAIRKGTLTENTANRYKSRLALAMNALRAKKKA